MPQRHQMPFNWYMPPGQMGPYHSPQNYPMWNRPMGPMRQTFPNRPMVPMGQQRPMGFRQGRQGRQGGQSGGILARLLKKAPKGNRSFPGMYPQMSRGGTATGSLLQSLTDPNAISSFLNNTQQVLQAAQQIGPMVSQYGPVIRNIPAMWKLYRGLKNAVSETTVEDAELQEVSITSNEPAQYEQSENNKSSETIEKAKQDHIPEDIGESSVQDDDNKNNDEFGIKGLSFPKLFF